MTIGVPALVIDREAPDYAQHMTTDVNDVLNRITTSVNTAVSDLESDISSLSTTISGLSPGWKKITTATASTSATINFTTGIDSTYDLYVFVLTGIRPDTNGVFLAIRISTDGGSSWKSGADYSWFLTNASDVPATTALGATGSAQARVSGVLTNTTVLNGIVEIISPSTAAMNPNLTRMAAFNSTNWQSQYGGFVYIAASAINGVQFLMSSGNIAAGTFTLYGVTK